jgi:type II secretory pathway pseudopilin PulG
MKMRSRKFRRAFTLIELTVAMAVTVALVTVMISISSIALDTWSRSRSEVRASRQAKSMADAMCRDFDALVVRKGNANQWVWAEADVPVGGPAPGERSPNGARLIFFSAATDRYDGRSGTAESKGNISTIVYELHYSTPTGKQQNDEMSTFVLYRKIVDPDQTFSNLLGTADLSKALKESSVTVGDLRNFICENIYQFTATFHIDIERPGGFTRTLQIPVQVGSGRGTFSVPRFAVFGNRIEAEFAGGGDVTVDDLRGGTLAGVEISMTVLTDAGLEQLRRRKFRSNDERSGFIAKNSYQYSKLIRFPQG